MALENSTRIQIAPASYDTVPVILLKKTYSAPYYLSVQFLVIVVAIVFPVASVGSVKVSKGDLLLAELVVESVPTSYSTAITFASEDNH